MLATAAGPQPGRGQALPSPLDRGVPCMEGHASHIAGAVCDVRDLRILEALREELSRSIRPFSGQWRTFTTESGEECKAPWRNGMGSESVEDLEGRGFRTQASVLRKLSEDMNVEMLLWWINVYDDGSVGCEFHHDGHGMINNITVGASFGATRDITFKHHESGQEVSFTQQNGDVFAFDDFVDSNYMHGLHPIQGEAGQRISVIIMGRRKTQARVSLCPLSDFARVLGGSTPGGRPCGACTGCLRLKRGP
mmetsp:Transcript_60512/g.187465  ORF Transcript_60512/g.187465 Transcript_60512/m.187465 type:complete len:251 (+) Transcript_60512:61-813(+)